MKNPKWYLIIGFIIFVSMLMTGIIFTSISNDTNYAILGIIYSLLTIVLFSFLFIRKAETLRSSDR